MENRSASAERLTVKDNRGYWVKGCAEVTCDVDCWYCDLARRAMERLVAYEETGLTPEEVRALALK